MTLAPAIRRVRRNVRDYGWGVTLRKAVGRLGGWLYESRVYRIYGIDLRRAPDAVPAADSALVYRLIGPEERDAIAQIEALEDWLEGSVERRLRQGALCLTAFDGDRVAGFNLVSFGRVTIPLIGLEHRFPPRHAWSEQITVHHAYRGRGIAAELRRRIFVELKRRGVERFWGGALALNTASLSLARKVGFRELIEVRYWRSLGFEGRRYRRLRA